MVLTLLAEPFALLNDEFLVADAKPAVGDLRTRLLVFCHLGEDNETFLKNYSVF